MRAYIWIAVVLLALCLPASADGASAMQTVKNQVSQLLEVLKSDAGEAQKADEIRGQVSRFFNFGLMSRLALSYHWEKMNSGQQERFVSLYKSLLETVYMDRLLNYENEKVEFIDEIQLTDTRVQVRTSVVSKEKEIPIHYKLIRVDERWKVYDLVIENVSMAKNYRAQFSSFLKDNTYEDLLDWLRVKTGENG